MVDLTFNSRPRYFVPLALLRYISTVSLPKSGDDEPDIIEELSYLGRKGVAAIKGTCPVRPYPETTFDSYYDLKMVYFKRDGPSYAR